MATLFLDRAQLEIRTDGATLTLYENGERRSTVPVALLERVVFQGRQTRLESGVLLKLAEAGVATLFLSSRNSRQAAMVLGPRHNDASVRIAQTLRISQDEFCTNWTRSLVGAKLRRQHELLMWLEQERPDVRKPLFDAQASLSRIRAQLPETTALESFRGLEGAAARAYFAGLAAVFPAAAGFNGRNRRPPRDPVNACLSLGYTLLHFDAVRATHVAGLDPLIGFYHKPSYGRESLASDLIEPLRPLIDRWIWNLFRTDVLRLDHFQTQKDTGACLLGKAGRERFYTAWEPFAAIHRRWLRARCAEFARDLRNEGQRWLDLSADTTAES